MIYYSLLTIYYSLLTNHYSPYNSGMQGKREKKSCPGRDSLFRWVWNDYAPSILLQKLVTFSSLSCRAMYSLTVSLLSLTNSWFSRVLSL